MNTRYDKKMGDFAYFVEGSYKGYMIEKAEWNKKNRSIDVYISHSDTVPENETVIEDCLNIFNEIKYQDRLYKEPFIDIKTATQEIIDERKLLWTV